MNSARNNFLIFCSSKKPGKKEYEFCDTIYIKLYKIKHQSDRNQKGFLFCNTDIWGKAYQWRRQKGTLENIHNSSGV